MSFINPDVLGYYQSLQPEEPVAVQALVADNAKLAVGHMQTAPETANFLQFLIRLLRVKHILEIGTFTGYSALKMALALPKDGALITCDKDGSHIQTAQKYWQMAGVCQKITPHMGKAHVFLEELEKDHKTFDLIYVDADKLHYKDYLGVAWRLCGPDGLVVFDNTLGYHSQYLGASQSKILDKLAQFNSFVQEKHQTNHQVLPIGDGVTLIYKKNA